MAQRGGGGFRGGGGMGGGGFRGGGFGGGGFRGGGFGGGGFRGGGFGGFRGGFGGFRGGFGRFGFGRGFGGWGGWGWPVVWGGGWGGGYWPGYYDDYAYPYAGYASYPAYSGYPAYYQPQAAQPASNVTVVYPPQQPAPERSTTIIREYDEYGREIVPGGQAAAALPNSSPIYLIALKDHSIRAVAAYWVDGATLHFVTLDHQQHQAPLETVDRELSMQLNRERRVGFSLAPR
jgi:hypothetical protein